MLNISDISPQRMDTKLSDLQEKINDAQAPLPLFTCLHVKPDVSELKFAGVYLCFYSFYCMCVYVCNGISVCMCRFD